MQAIYCKSRHLVLAIAQLYIGLNPYILQLWVYISLSFTKCLCSLAYTCLSNEANLICVCTHNPHGSKLVTSSCSWVFSCPSHKERHQCSLYMYIKSFIRKDKVHLAQRTVWFLPTHAETPLPPIYNKKFDIRKDTRTLGAQRAVWCQEYFHKYDWL